VETIQQRDWPPWNRNIFLGHPVVGDPIYQLAYPVLTGLGLIFGTARGFALGLWLQLLLAAGLTYGWLRAVGCRKTASLSGALVYVLSGYMVTWFETNFWISTLSLLPGILWTYELAIQRRSLIYTALAALLMGLAILGGQFVFMIVFSFFLALYALGRTVEAYRREDKNFLWPLLAVILMALPVALVSAILLLPSIEFLGLSRRTVDAGLNDPLPLNQLVTLVIPNFFGNPASIGPYWGSGNYSGNTIYVGLVALILALLAPLTHRRFSTWYIAILTGALIYFVLGGPGVSLLGQLPWIRYASLHRSNFLLPLLIALLTGLTLSQPKISVRYGFGVVAGLMVLTTAAVGMNREAVALHWDVLRPEFFKAAGLVIVTLVLLWLGQRGTKSRWAMTVGIPVLIFLDLFIIGSSYNPSGPIEVFNAGYAGNLIFTGEHRTLPRGRAPAA